MTTRPGHADWGYSCSSDVTEHSIRMPNMPMKSPNHTRRRNSLRRRKAAIKQATNPTKRKTVPRSMSARCSRSSTSTGSSGFMVDNLLPDLFVRLLIDQSRRSLANSHNCLVLHFHSLGIQCRQCTLPSEAIPCERTGTTSWNGQVALARSLKEENQHHSQCNHCCQIGRASCRERV